MHFAIGKNRCDPSERIDRTINWKILFASEQKLFKTLQRRERYETNSNDEHKSRNNRALTELRVYWITAQNVLNEGIDQTTVMSCMYFKLNSRNSGYH